MALTMRDRQVETVRKLLAEDPVRPFPLARILHGPLQPAHLCVLDPAFSCPALWQAMLCVALALNHL